MSIKVAGILKTEALSNHIDHLAPLCHYFDAPLLAGDELLAKLAKRYYPNLSVDYVDHWALEPLALQEKYDLIIHSFFWHEGFLDLVNESQSKEPTRWLFTPHGNSDKGYHSYLMERFAHQDMTLLYGDHMTDFLKRKNVFEQLKHPITMGNIRYQYYIDHQSFFDEITEKEVFSHFTEKRPTILYAPTWNDKEDSTSFFDALELILEQLTDSYNIIVKVHPYLLFHLPGRVFPLIGKLEKNQNVKCLVDFPLIYPILSRTDIYLGDFSSVGYDFLAYDRPMFFMNVTNRDLKDKSRLLHQCGKVLEKEEFSSLKQSIEKGLSQDHLYQPYRKKMYPYAFSSPGVDQMREKVLSLCKNH